jgi:ClpP class serine protease
MSESAQGPQGPERDSKGFGLSLLDRIQNEGSVHHDAVRAIESITQRNLICYTAFLRHPAGAIVQEDSQLVEHLLRSVSLAAYPETLDLLLHTPGGDPTAAERIVMTRRRSRLVGPLTPTSSCSERWIRLGSRYA